MTTCFPAASAVPARLIARVVLSAPPFWERMEIVFMITVYADVKTVYGTASIVGNDRVVFNVGGNRYRLVVRFDYARRIGFVRFVGTHTEYEAVDVSNI